MQKLLLTPFAWPCLLSMMVLGACERIEAPKPSKGYSQVGMTEKAPEASPLTPPFPEHLQLVQSTEMYVQSYLRGRASYLQVDKPIYTPGEVLWVRSLVVSARDFTPMSGTLYTTYDLINPKGSTVLSRRVMRDDGLGWCDMELPSALEGGEYTLRLTTHDGLTDERKVILSTYEPPQIKKKLEFVRKAYGPGDEVMASIEVLRGTGEPLAQRELTAVVWLDGDTISRVPVTTNAQGTALVKFALPSAIDKGDGLLTVMVEEGGITESISRSIPIVLAKVDMAFYPEGGSLVNGLASRVYFAAKNPVGKPADVEGDVFDSRGKQVASFTSVHDGMGRFAFTPSPAESYFVSIRKPEGVKERYPLPSALPNGCVLHTYDDPTSHYDALRVGVRCSSRRAVVVSAWLREKQFATASSNVTPGSEQTLYLTPTDKSLLQSQGVVRVTLFDRSLEPLAERLVYRQWNKTMKVKVKPDRESYGPRDKVTLEIETSDLEGKPVAAALGLSVADDTVLSYADDKTGHLLAHLYLERELTGKVEEPNFYYKEKQPERAEPTVALDMLLGTAGWRKFEWVTVRSLAMPSIALDDREVAGGEVLAARPRGGILKMEAAGDMKGGDEVNRAVPMAEAQALPPAAMPLPAPAAAQPMLEALAPGAPAEPPRPEAQMAAPEKPMGLAVPDGAAVAHEPMANKDLRAAEDAGIDAEIATGVAAGAPMPRPARGEAGKAVLGGRLQEFAKEKRARQAPLGAIGLLDADNFMLEEMAIVRGREVPLAKVRVFPVPDYSQPYSGPRTDFRQTLFWAPDVKTGDDGKATVSFYLSDAVTSFRITTEGISSVGLPGRDETVITSKLPFSMAIKLPTEVSEGDVIDLPLTLTNETGTSLDITLNRRLSSLVTEEGPGLPTTLRLNPNGRESLFTSLKVTGKEGKGELRFAALANQLGDDFVRTLTVAPLGFPLEQSVSGVLKGEVAVTVTVDDFMPGTVHGLVKLYPSAVSDLTSGLDSLLQQPYGCFEQASSTNYPNVMVLQMLKKSQAITPALLSKTTSLLDSGYARLTGYETRERGYEWFGSNPGHEALTAYGLMQFSDMQKVYPAVDSAMMGRTADWLMKRRDGKGGYERNPQALDSFGGASPDVTNAYITYALTEAGRTDLDLELKALAAVGTTSSDAYLVALAANAMLNAGRSEASTMVNRLIAMQKPDGHFEGATHSITRSTGQNLSLETTAFAVLAALKASRMDVAKLGIEWLTKQRSSYGGYGTTQATVLALRAMVAWSEAMQAASRGGTLTVLVNGRSVGSVTLEGTEENAVVLGDFGPSLVAGANKVVIRLEGEGSMPFSVGASWRSEKPRTSDAAQVTLSTTLERDKVKMGENVRLTARVESRSAEGLPMTLARVGIPGGLNFQPWQLKDLTEKKKVDFIETRAREVILYWRALEPRAVKEVPLDLVAEVPGRYTAPASSAYLYYTDEHKVWTPPVSVEIAH